jgi:hypothetical protein
LYPGVRINVCVHGCCVSCKQFSTRRDL